MGIHMNTQVLERNFFYTCWPVLFLPGPDSAHGRARTLAQEPAPAGRIDPDLLCSHSPPPRRIAGAPPPPAGEPPQPSAPPPVLHCPARPPDRLLLLGSSTTADRRTAPGRRTASSCSAAPPVRRRHPRPGGHRPRAPISWRRHCTRTEPGYCDAASPAVVHTTATSYIVLAGKRDSAGREKEVATGDMGSRCRRKQRRPSGADDGKRCCWRPVNGKVAPASDEL